jgi:ribonucleotide monophosphatase NagD (HAD superfamily)
LCSGITRQLQAINEKIDVLDSNEHKQVDTDSVIINEDGMYDYQKYKKHAQARRNGGE